MIWRMIVRNILRNRKNSAVVFLLISLITLFFFAGNSIMGQTNLGLRATYIDNLTADVVIQKDSGTSMNLFGANSPVIEGSVPISTLPAWDLISALADSSEDIEDYAGQISGYAYFQMDNYQSGVLICGAEPERYFNCLPGIALEAGEFLRPGEYGAMISSERADSVKDATGRRPVPGDPVLLSAAGSQGFKIREVPLTGIYHYRSPGQFREGILITDPQTARVLSSIQLAGSAFESELPTDEGEIFTAADPESFFSPPAAGAEADEADGFYESYEGEGFSPEELGAFLAASDGAGAAETQGGDWNFMLIKLKKGISPGRFIRQFNKKLIPLGARADGWRTAAGIAAITALLVQTFFNLGGVLVSIAGIIVVINMLLISVFRRTREIGVLRAIGAPNAYIRALIMGENCTLAFAAGLAGVAAGLALFRLINSLELLIPNNLLASLLGGQTLHISTNPLTALVSFCIALFLGAAASLYPVETAVHIDPVTAVRQG